MPVITPQLLVFIVRPLRRCGLMQGSLVRRPHGPGPTAPRHGCVRALPTSDNVYASWPDVVVVSPWALLIPAEHAPNTRCSACPTLFSFSAVSWPSAIVTDALVLLCRETSVNNVACHLVLRLTSIGPDPLSVLPLHIFLIFPHYIRMRPVLSIRVRVHKNSLKVKTSEPLPSGNPIFKDAKGLQSAA